MEAKKIFAFILALILGAAVPSFAQLIPRSGGGGGGGGGGGDASAANQATQITALPLEDAPHTTGDRGSFSLGVIHTGLGNVGAIGDYSQFSTDLAGRQFNIPMTTGNTGIADQLGKREDGATSNADTGVSAMQVRRDTLIADASVSTDGDFLHSFTDNRGARWTHNDPVDAQLDLQIAESVTANGTNINVSGVNMVLVHVTNDATWNRTGNISFEGSFGGGPLSDVRSLPYVQWQNDAATDPTEFRGRSGSAVLNAVNNNQMGYWVDVRGFQNFRA